MFNSIDDDYQHVAIAKAVRASAGFPVFFRPVEFRYEGHKGWNADGGIVSNYPAWIFSNEFRIRLLDALEYRPLASRPWAHFGLRLDRRPVAENALDGAAKVYISSLVRLLLVGEARSDLETRLEKLVTRSFTVQQPSGDTGVPPKADMLNFAEVTPRVVRDMYNRGRDAAGKGLGILHYTLPKRDVIEPLLKRLIDRALLVLGQGDNSTVLFRSNIFIPSKTTLFIQYSVNMTGDPDENMKLQFDAGLTGFCFTLRRPLICNLERIGQLVNNKECSSLMGNLFGMTQTQHGDVKGDRTWLASVPIFDPFASYPRDLSSTHLPHPGVHFHPLAGRTDGGRARGHESGCTSGV